MKYLRRNILEMQGYTPGEQPRGGRIIKLNTNENPYPPSPKVLEAIREAATSGLRRYPDFQATSFREAAGKVLGVDPDMILACNGSDDALTILTRATMNPQDLMVTPTPSYPLYKILAELQDCRYEERPFGPGGTLDEQFPQGAKLVYVPNPNSPTGTFLPPTRLAELASRTEGLFVSDEAYADFGPGSCISLVGQPENLVVTRTLSKSYSLAGIRFGFIVATPEIVFHLRKVKDSYNCDAVSIAAATAAISDQAYYADITERIKVTRTRLAEALQSLGFTVTPSHANFVWAQRAESVKPLYEGLKVRGILVRYLRYPDTEGLRITVGTDEETDACINGLRELV